LCSRALRFRIKACDNGLAAVGRIEMRERAALVTWLRGELVGPGQSPGDRALASFSGRDFVDGSTLRHGALGWRAPDTEEVQEVLYFDREQPLKKYGIGLLHPVEVLMPNPDRQALEEADTQGVDTEALDSESGPDQTGRSEASEEDGGAETDDFDVTSPDIRRPSTIGISFCAEIESGGPSS
jgi:hypothetical protein